MISPPAPTVPLSSHVPEELPAASFSTRRRIPLCDDWLFSPSETAPDAAHRNFSHRQWTAVALPHTPRIEPEVVQFPFQGICWYRRTLPAHPSWAGKRVTLEFGAAMQIADIWVNGRHTSQHLGGYLPFSVDLSGILGAGRNAEVAVRLDNRDTPLCPPGKPLAGMDFSYFGGLYREAHLLVTGNPYVTDPLRGNPETGGGIFIRTASLSPESATLTVLTHVANDSPEPIRRCRVETSIFAPNGDLVCVAKTFPLMIADGHRFSQTIDVPAPEPWHPDQPRLYRLATAVFADDLQTDSSETRFGIRRISVGKRFYINGKEFRIMGTNRHQDHPFIGNAVPPNAHRRDARRIKDAGFNFVRLSHYPQDPAFLDACDEFGLLVQAAIPGWQQFWLNPSFVSRSFQDVRELIRRDRNHPSIVFWEPNLNETGVGEPGAGHDDWCRAAHEIAHEEYPGDQCLTFGDDYPPKPGWDWDVKGFWREYGDFAFGGNQSTSRHRRGEGEKAMLQQAWNYLWTFNHLNARFCDPEAVYLGCATWVMFDYNRGYYPDACTCGAMDIFRLPKYLYYFFRSQRDPQRYGPALFIASDWTLRAGETKVVVFSNCDEVELKLNGESLGRRGPDAGPDTDYNGRSPASLETVGEGFDTTGGNPFDGGNANHIPHPPFTFAGIPYEQGTLTAVGRIAGREAAVHEVRTPGIPAMLALEASLARVPLSAEGLDVLFLSAFVKDRHGAVVPLPGRPVTFEIDGPGELLGPNPAPTDGGIASILLRTNRFQGGLCVRACSDGLAPARLEMDTASNLYIDTIQP